MKTMSKYLIIFVLLGAFAANTFAKVDGLGERYPHLRREEGIDFFGVNWRDAKPNQYVYLVPAHAGATVFVLVGNVVGWPVRIVFNLCNGDWNGDHYLPPVGFSTRYFAPVGGYILGSPFWVLEKGLYEYPKEWIMGKDEEYKFADD